MTTFYLVRHGNKLPFSGDPGLSEIGIEQARKTGEHFAQNHAVSSIYASPYLRTQETAKYIAKAVGIEIVVDEIFKERMNWGDDSSLSFEQFLIEWNKTSQDRDYQPMIGDSSKKAGVRMKAAIEALYKKYPNEQIVVVSHGGVIMDTLRTIFGDEYVSVHNKDFLRKGIRECAITKIMIKNNVWKMEDFDSIDHLIMG